MSDKSFVGERMATSLRLCLTGLMDEAVCLAYRSCKLVSPGPNFFVSCDRALACFTLFGEQLFQLRYFTKSCLLAAAILRVSQFFHSLVLVSCHWCSKHRCSIKLKAMLIRFNRLSLIDCSRSDRFRRHLTDCVVYGWFSSECDDWYVGQTRLLTTFMY